MSTKELKAWTVLSEKEIFSESPWIKLSVQSVKLPSERVVDNFYQLTAMNYVGIVALTEDGKFILERQYKHGVRGVSLMIPGGAIDAGESPLEAAKRELKEETGYEADQWEDLGTYTVDANHRVCEATVFFARGAKKTTEPVQDDMEEVEMVFKDLNELETSMNKGEIKMMSAVMSLLLAIKKVSAFNTSLNGATQ